MKSAFIDWLYGAGCYDHQTVIVYLAYDDRPVRRLGIDEAVSLLRWGYLV